MTRLLKHIAKAKSCHAQANEEMKLRAIDVQAPPGRPPNYANAANPEDPAEGGGMVNIILDGEDNAGDWVDQDDSDVAMGAHDGIDMMVGATENGLDLPNDIPFTSELNEALSSIAPDFQADMHMGNIPEDDMHHNLNPAKEEGEYIEAYPRPGAGAPIRAATEEEMRAGEPGNIGTLADPDNFEVADCMLTSKMSAGDRTRFLGLKKVSANGNE